MTQQGDAALLDFVRSARERAGSQFSLPAETGAGQETPPPASGQSTDDEAAFWQSLSAEDREAAENDRDRAAELYFQWDAARGTETDDEETEVVPDDEAEAWWNDLTPEQQAQASAESWSER